MTTFSEWLAEQDDDLTRGVSTAALRRAYRVWLKRQLTDEQEVE